MNDMYYRLCRSLTDIGEFFPCSQSPFDFLSAQELEGEIFTSVYYYTGEQVAEADTIISVGDKKGGTYSRKRGVGKVTDTTGKQFSTFDNVLTNKLTWDLDDENNWDNVAQNVKELISKLISYGVNPETIQLYFSGKKGVHVIVEIDEYISPIKCKSICFIVAQSLTTFGDGLSTFDESIYNPSRIFRLPLTKRDNGMYKIPLNVEELDLSISEIHNLARITISPEMIHNVWGVCKLSSTTIPFDLFTVTTNREVPENRIVIDSLPESFDDIDFKKKPTYLTPAKYVLEMGYIPRGFGQEARMILASSYKAAGKSEEQCFRALQAVSDHRIKRYGKTAKFDDNELYSNVIATVYSDQWQGGTYGIYHPLLSRIDDALPAHLKVKEKSNFIDNDTIFAKFRQFALDIDKNTLKIGIEDLDNRVRLLVGSTFGIVGVPGSSKTTIAMEFLAHNSLKGEKSMFYSLDMRDAFIALKQIQRVSKLSTDEIFEMAKDTKKFEQYKKLADEEFKNVIFNFKYGVTPDDIRNDILTYEQRTGNKIRIVIIDYLELIHTPYQDPVVGAAVAAQQLANVASETDVLIGILLQTQKTVLPGQEIESMRSIKGGSNIEQSLRVALGISREGQQLKYQEYDSTVTINILKNTLGQLGTVLVGWNGARSRINKLTEDQKKLYNEVKELKKQEEDAKKSKDRSW